jgi:L-methionine (R)-S-oxide reductase
MFLPTHDQDDGDVQAALLAKSGRLLSIACSTEDIVAILRAHARSIVGSDGIAVVLRDGDQCFYAAEDAIEPLWRGQRFPMSSCVSGWAMLNKRTVVIPDIESDPRVPQVAYQRTSMRTLAMVPLGEPEPVAALGAYWCAYIEPDDATVRRLEILARMAAIAFGRIAAMPAAKDALDR